MTNKTANNYSAGKSSNGQKALKVNTGAGQLSPPGPITASPGGTGPANGAAIATIQVPTTPNGTPINSNNRTVLSLLEKYQKERLFFVQTVAEQTLRETNIDVLVQNGTISLLKPLLSDSVSSIRQSAAVALGRLANFSSDIATSVVESGILNELITALPSENRFYKKAAAFVIRAVARHSAELAQAAVDAGSTKALVLCLEEFDPGVKESASWALGYIARHNADLAQTVVDAGAIPLILLCLQEPELPLKRIAASTLAEISRHTPDLAQAVVDAKAVPVMTSLIHGQISKNTGAPNRDFKLIRQILSSLSHIAKHSLSLAEAVVDGEVFPHVYKYFKLPEPAVRRGSAELVGEIVKHSVALAQLFAQTGGIAVVVDYLSSIEGSARVPGIMILGHVASMNETLAMAVIASNAIGPLANALDGGNVILGDEIDYSVSAACWALGQIGRYSPEHSKPVYSQAVLPKLLKIYTGTLNENVPSSAYTLDLRSKSKKALKAIIQNTTDIKALDPILQLSTPLVVLKNMMAQNAKILPNDVESRKFMVTSGGLSRVQLIAAQYATTPGQNVPQPASDASQEDKRAYHCSKLAQSIAKVNSCFPEDIVRYYSPGFSTALLSKIDDFVADKGQSNQIAGAAQQGAPIASEQQKPAEQAPQQQAQTGTQAAAQQSPATGNSKHVSHEALATDNSIKTGQI